jgi:hypothetical protein
MKQYYLFALLFFTAISITKAQFNDNFSTGALDPAWTGEREKFKIEEGILRLNATEAGTAYIARPSSMIENTQWDFWVRISFEPSDNNYPLIYLASNSGNLNDALNGYYVRIGKTGTDNKRLFFFRQDGETKTQILQGSTIIAGSSNNVIRVRVTRDNAGKWDFYADPTGSNLFLPQGSVTDNTYNSTSYFGMKCVYTVSNISGFYFDDIIVGDIIPDTEKPTIKHIVPINSTTLDVHFSKAIDKTTSETTTNYFVNTGIGAPVIAERIESKPYIARLIFTSEFVPKTVYNISISNVQDVFGNTMNDFSGNFTLYYPEKYDVVFNEIMPRPTPTVELPAYKYIEFYNTSDYSINVEGWVFKSGTDAEKELPFGIIPPKGYIILVNSPDLPHFSAYDNVIGASVGVNFLTSTGRTLILYDLNGEIVHTISYTDKWYNDTSKDDGGWSIEQIDPLNFCGGINNWKASASLNGGTPGAINSVNANNPDNVQPDLLRAGYDDNYGITLVFSEPMDETTLFSINDYEIDNGIGKPAAVNPVSPSFQNVRLILSNPLQQGTIYTVSVASTLADCSGNLINKKTAKVAIPELADSLDIVINELLFNAPTGVSRYIELYNRSQKVIDLSRYRVSSKDTIANILTSIQEISSSSYLLFPDEYAVITTDPNSVKNYYPFHNPYSFITIGTMPSMTTTRGIVALSHINMQIIDMLVYTESMQYALLTDKKGVALERLNPNRPTMDLSNWHSAAEGIGFGTPGMKNSQFTLNLVSQDNPIEVYPEIFSPDNTGHNDVLNIAYEFAEPGFVANITIFDSKGRPIRALTRSLLLATKGVVTWDGTTDDNTKAYIGIYIIHVEVFDTKGNVKHYKKTAVLAGRL